jgi:hypothetical protein
VAGRQAGTSSSAVVALVAGGTTGAGKDTYRQALEHSVRNLVIDLRNLGKDEAVISLEPDQLTLTSCPRGLTPIDNQAPVYGYQKISAARGWLPFPTTG